MTRKTLILTASILILGLTVLQAQTSLEKGVLWEVTGNGLEKPSYLYGIINFLPKKEYNIPREVKGAIKKCETFATKIIYDNQAQKKFNKAVRIPNNGWINDYLTDDELNQLRLLLLRDFEVREHAYHDFYSRLQPIILVTTTTALWLDDNIIYTEQELADLAKKNRMDFIGLGSVQEEIEAFEKFPITDQVKALKHTVNHFDQHIESYNAMVNFYLNEHNLVKVKDETLKATNESERFKTVYYDDRLVNWFPKVVGMMQQTPTFFALGAPYLVGEVSLIKRLRAEGYTVKAVDI